MKHPFFDHDCYTRFSVLDRSDAFFRDMRACDIITYPKAEDTNLSKHFNRVFGNTKPVIAMVILALFQDHLFIMVSKVSTVLNAARAVTAGLGVDAIVWQ